MKFSSVCLTAFAMLMGSLLSAQSDFSGFVNPSFSVHFKNEHPWSFAFGIENRDAVYENEDFDFQKEFIELNHYTHYHFDANHKVGLGIRYRFTDDLSFKTPTNETRLVEEYTLSHQRQTLSFGHRFRLSQRFRSYFTQRIRYRFSVKFPLSSQPATGETSLSLRAEPVWEISPHKKPSFGQRVSTVINTPIFKKLSGSFGLEYRYRNYTQNPYTQLYLLSSLKLAL